MEYFYARPFNRSNALIVSQRVCKYLPIVNPN